jgi:acyl-CoA thioester hydrolase
MATPDFERSYTVIWADLDPNRHLRNTAYSEYGTHTRFAFLAAHGITQERLAKLGVGPVLFSEHSEFRREVRLDETLIVNVRVTGASPDGARWRIRHEVFKHKPNGQRALAATIDLDGAWLDLRTRKLCVPPPDVLAAFEAMPRSDDCETLSARRR